MNNEAVARQRRVDAFAEGTDHEALRRARIDVLFKPSAALEEMVAAAERDPDFAHRVLTTHNRVALDGYRSAKRRAIAAQGLIDRHVKREET